MRNVWVATLVTLVTLMGSTFWFSRNTGKQKPLITKNQGGKKLILIVIDSLQREPLESLMSQNKLPAFSFLKENGSYTNRMVSSFPTMSVTIDSTILTGTYPDQHRVPAIRWYNPAEKRLIHYGDGFYSTIKSGIKQVMKDSLFNLNNRHLSNTVLTIHEELAPHRSTASINNLVYRAGNGKTLTIPGPISNIETMAPPYFVLGSFHRYKASNFYDSMIHYYGINNKVSIQHLVDLVKNNQLPSFTAVYLPDLDHEAHKHGKNLNDSVIKVDRQLQTLLNSFGSLKKALNQHVFIVMGDSGVSKIMNVEKEAIVNLDYLFRSMKVAPLGRSRPSDEIALAVNERMSFIYLLKDELTDLDVINKLKQDKRLDTISWRDKDWIYVMQGGTAKQMRFRTGDTVTDEYNQEWDIEGEMTVLDIKSDQLKKKIVYGIYPDGLMRLYSAHHSHEGRFLIVTSKPGYEMKGTSSPTHPGGGAHGAFHEVDSYIPFFIAGTVQRPRYLRIIDLKDFILNLLNDKANVDTPSLK